MSKYFIIEPPVAATPAPDYSSAVSGISTELNDIDTDTTSIAAQIILIEASLATIALNSTTFATNSTTIANKLTEIESHQKRLKELAEGEGLHIIGAYDYFGLISLYKLLIEEGKILESPTIQKSAVKEALERVSEYRQAFSEIPREF